MIAWVSNLSCASLAAFALTSTAVREMVGFRFCSAHKFPPIFSLHFKGSHGRDVQFLSIIDHMAV